MTIPGATPLDVLPWRTLVAYALPAVGVSAASTLFVVLYLKFATDRLGVPALAMGGIFLAAKVWNALADPLVGSFSDRTRARIGRRRAWLLGCALPFAAFTWMTWSPPSALHGLALSAWVAVSVFGFYTALTAFDVPHAAWGVELTHDPQSRNRVFGLKYFVRAIGLALAFAMVGAVGHPENGRASASVFAAAVGGGTALAIFALLPLLPRERVDYQGRGGVSIARALGDVWGNREARLLITVFFIEAIGVGGLSVLVPYVTEYVMKTPHLTTAMLGVFVGSTLLAIPVWVVLARRIEKQRLWLFAMVQAGVGFGMLLFLGEGDWLLMVVSGTLAGSAQACGNSIGQSLKADVIDLDELRTGERKEGAYFAAWSFVNKLGNALLASSAGFALHFAGYVPNLAEQTPLVRGTMVFLLGGMPLLGYGFGALLFTRFSLTRARHDEVRQALDARAASRA
jgi:GPH family glycoside/pentoside/hexuronide:cation symporter